MAEARGPRVSWIDRAVGYFSPQAGLRRLRARMAADIVLRHYEAAAASRRTQGWRRTSGDANAVLTGALARLREHARDLVRNNPHAKSAIGTIADHTVGWGIVAKPNPMNKAVADVWKAWAESTACDSDGRHDLAGLQKLAWRTVVESGEVLIRRRRRLPDDGLPLPLHIMTRDGQFPLGRPDLAQQHSDQRTFPGAIPPDDTDDFTLLDPERHVAQRPDRLSPRSRAGRTRWANSPGASCRSSGSYSACWTRRPGWAYRPRSTGSPGRADLTRAAILNARPKQNVIVLVLQGGEIQKPRTRHQPRPFVEERRIGFRDRRIEAHDALGLTSI